MRCRNCGRKNYLALWCTPCQKEYAKETRAATVREIAEALADCQHKDESKTWWVRVEIDGPSQGIESALWSLLGGKPEDKP